MMKYFRLLVITVSTLTSIRAAEPVDPSIKLREQLRSVLLQLRTAQTDSANAQAAQTAADAKNKDLSTKVDTLTKRIETLNKESNIAKVASDGSIATLNNKLAEREKRLVLFTEANEKWKTG